jgi:hypothetical protein
MVLRFGMGDAKTEDIPMTTANKLSHDNSKELDKTVYPYMELVGSLLYLSTCTRPDIAYSVGAFITIYGTPNRTTLEGT